MATRFENMRGTAPVVSELQNKRLPVPKSSFDLSRNVSFDAFMGAIIPFDCIEILPDSDYEIQYNILALTSNPLVRRLLTGCTVYIHTYAQYSRDIDEAFPTFVTRGRSGTVSRTIPVTTTGYGVENPVNHTKFDMGSHQFSPSAYLGVPPHYYLDLSKNNRYLNYDGLLAMTSVVEGSSDSPTILNPVVTFCAYPLAMYQQICIYNYLPSNLLQNNPQYYPEDELHLKFSATRPATVYNLSYNDAIAGRAPFRLFGPTASSSEFLHEHHDYPYNFAPHLDMLHVRQFKGDDFNTGLPFPDLIRGDIPSVNLGSETINVSNLPVTGTANLPAGTTLVTDGLNVYFKNVGGSDPYQLGSVRAVPAFNAGDVVVNAGLLKLFDAAGIQLQNLTNLQTSIGNDVSSEQPTLYTPLRTNTAVSLPVTGTASGSVTGTIQSNVTLNQLRALEVLTLFRERMALSDGSYNELIKAQYNTSPKMHVGKPMYIGGTKQEIVFNEVTQTSESASTPLGTTGSKGVSAGSGYIGRFHSDDFGYIMSVLSIVPDTVYTQGLDPMWSRTTQDRYYYPIMENLAPVPILNKELYFSGNSVTDNDVFAYQERNYEYKSRRNVARGSLALPHSLDDSMASYVMRRRFSGTPSLTYEFTAMRPSNLDYDVFSNKIDCPFIFSIGSNIRAVLPMSYVTVPGAL